MTFEQLTKRLEEIVAKLEGGTITLDEVSKLFGEGADITKKCYEMLAEKKGKVTVLREELDKLVEKEFENE